jgi:hypothetical protein
MKSRILALVVLSCLACVTAVAQKTNIDWDRQANFSQFHTYAWEESPHPANGLWHQRIVDAVDKQLQAKGLQKVDPSANPDMWVSYSKSIKDQKTVVGSGYGYGPGWGWGAWGMGGPSMYNTYVTKEATLVVELADVKDKQILWRGSATDTVSDNSNKNINNLDKAVAKLFKGYPPKGK